MNKFWNWFIHDSKNKIVIAQWPNWPLWVWLGSVILGLFVQGNFLSLVNWIGKLALLYWSYLEVVSGVNGFRKLLGLVVGASVVWGIFTQVQPL